LADPSAHPRCPHRGRGQAEEAGRSGRASRQAVWTSGRRRPRAETGRPWARAQARTSAVEGAGSAIRPITTLDDEEPSWCACCSTCAGPPTAPPATCAPRSRSQAARTTQALRVGSITTVTAASQAACTAPQSASRSALVVRNRRSAQTIFPVSSASAAQCDFRLATSIPKRSSRTPFSFCSGPRPRPSTPVELCIKTTPRLLWAPWSTSPPSPLRPGPQLRHDQSHNRRQPELQTHLSDGSMALLERLAVPTGVGPGARPQTQPTSSDHDLRDRPADAGPLHPGNRLLGHEQQQAARIDRRSRPAAGRSRIIGLFGRIRSRMLPISCRHGRVQGL
jgi:hypothetical protein